MAAGTIAMREGRWRLAWAAIDERLGPSALAYPVPAHANRVGYVLGGITFFGFLILTVTGARRTWTRRSGARRALHRSSA